MKDDDLTNGVIRKLVMRVFRVQYSAEINIDGEGA